MNLNSILLRFRNRAILLTGIVLLALASSCEELPEPLFTNAVINGNIDVHYDNYEAPEAISIIARGPYEKMEILTDSEGNYEFPGLGNGTYELEISKEGYGTKYHYGIQLFGNDTVSVRDVLYFRMIGRKLPKLYEVHTHETYHWLNEKSIAISTNKTQGDIPARAFLSEDEDVSYKNFQCTRNTGLRGSLDKVLITINDLPFESGKTIYLRVYICNPEEYYGYFNKKTGILTFSTLEKDERSSVMSFTMP